MKVTYLQEYPNVWSGVKCTVVEVPELVHFSFVEFDFIYDGDIKEAEPDWRYVYYVENDMLMCLQHPNPAKSLPHDVDRAHYYDESLVVCI